MEVAALGRPFCLGMLYDCRRDQLVPACVLRRRAEIEALRICSRGLLSVGAVTEPCGVSGNTHIDLN
ncbi:hypothetical protein F2P81_025996 [Scophthalmus maximus]|uniref:Uncharacterized protein n=1 Tax=Scophthalmus maximus TaxID=52904 RepID=A0A6A4RR85_SCOMX|nr:hypothetical protein F2P81_025996 [Scophthalmus maximus]